MILADDGSIMRDQIIDFIRKEAREQRRLSLKCAEMECPKSAWEFRTKANALQSIATKIKRQFQ